MRPAHNNVSEPSLGLERGSLKMKFDGIPESKKSLTSRPPILASAWAVSQLVARRTALLRTAFRNAGKNGKRWTRAFLANSLGQPRPKYCRNESGACCAPPIGPHIKGMGSFQKGGGVLNEP